MKGLLAALFLCGCEPGVGGYCTQDYECAGIERGYCAHAGACTRLCGPQDEQVQEPLGPPVDTSCPKGSVCSHEGVRFVCLPLCVSSSDCRDGFACRVVGEAKVCEFAPRPIPTEWCVISAPGVVCEPDPYGRPL